MSAHSNRNIRNALLACVIVAIMIGAYFTSLAGHQYNAPLLYNAAVAEKEGMSGDVYRMIPTFHSGPLFSPIKIGQKSNSYSQMGSGLGAYASQVVYSKILSWTDIRDVYRFPNQGTEWSPGGLCYGMASTEILYYEHYILGDDTKPYFPAQNPEAVSTFDLRSPSDWFDPYSYHYNLEPASGLNNATLAVIIHQVFQGAEIMHAPQSLEGLNFTDVMIKGQRVTLPYGIPSKENLMENFEFINKTLASGKPVMLVLVPTMDQIGTEYEMDDHAVVVWGITIYSNRTAKMYISDPNVDNVSALYGYLNMDTGAFTYSIPSWYKVMNPDGLSAPSYTGMHKPDWRYFCAISPTPMKKYWFRDFGRNIMHVDSTVTDVWSRYVFVVGDKNMVVRAKYMGSPMEDSFGEQGNSQTFSQGIPGSYAISEGNIELFAIPKRSYWDYEIDPVVSGSSFIFVFTMKPSISGVNSYGYFLDMNGSDYEYEIRMDDITEGISINPLNSSFDINFTAVHGNPLRRYFVLNATNISLYSGYTYNFTVENWSTLNSTARSSVRLDVYDSEGNLEHTYHLKNGEQGLGERIYTSTSGYYILIVPIAIVIAVLIIIAVVIRVGRAEQYVYYPSEQWTYGAYQDTGYMEYYGEYPPPNEDSDEEIIYF